MPRSIEREYGYMNNKYLQTKEKETNIDESPCESVKLDCEENTRKNTTGLHSWIKALSYLEVKRDLSKNISTETGNWGLWSQGKLSLT